ncbi:MAG: hypothetical protein J5I65_04575, partial [Aridibacter famidurans]|nr:hypothetical protein [Aridibacter famidurans]
NVDASTLYDALGNRVGIRSYDLWRYMIYDAFGKLVAEYGAPAEGQGGLKYVQQDWQGSVRTVTNSNGFVVARFDHQAFGSGIGYGVGERKIEQGYSVDRVTTQGYGLTESDPSAGQQHTWWRKLETEAGRWTGIDPLNASQRIGNPQSLNRFTYVLGDPVNLVDPSGLDGGPVTTWWSLFGSLIILGWEVGFVPEDPIDERPGTGGGQEEDEKTSCERFVDRVRQIANEVMNSDSTTKNGDFVRRMWEEFADSGNKYSSDGFKKEFQDFGGSSNQARHYTGGFYAGWHLGETGGRLLANAREVSWEFGTIWGVIPTIRIKPETPSQKADKALNAVSAKHGIEVFANFRENILKLADRIKEEVCDY